MRSAAKLEGQTSCKLNFRNTAPMTQWGVTHLQAGLVPVNVKGSPPPNYLRCAVEENLGACALGFFTA